MQVTEIEVHKISPPYQPFLEDVLTHYVRPPLYIARWCTCNLCSALKQTGDCIDQFMSRY